MSDSSTSSENNDPLNHARNQARQAAATMRDAATEAIRDIRHRGEAVAGDLKHKADDLKQNLETYVRKNPTKSVLISAGAGFLLGLLIRR